MMNVLDLLLSRINRSWTLVVINDAIFYVSFFTTLLLGIQFPHLTPWPFQLLIPIIFLGMTVVQGIRTINLYLKMDRFQKDTLPSFSWQNFSVNTWVQINDKSSLSKKLNVGSSGYIRIKDLPDGLKGLGEHILAVGHLNGMRRMNLPITSLNRKIALLKLAIGLLSAQHPERGYIYGNDEVVKYFAEQYHIALGLSGIEVLREYEKNDRHELYISLGHSLAEAILQYFDQLNILNTSLAVQNGISEVILIAFSSIIVRKQGQYYRPPRVLLRRLPREFRLLLASQGILTSKTKEGYSILVCERNKLSHFELTSDFGVLYQATDVRLGEPFRLFNIAALTFCNKKIRRSSLERLGSILYGEDLAQELQLLKYQERGLIQVENNQLVKGLFLESHFCADDLEMLKSYSVFLSSLFEIGINSWKLALPLNMDKSSKEDYQRMIHQQNERIKELTQELQKTRESYVRNFPRLILHALLALNQNKISFENLIEEATNAEGLSPDFLDRLISSEPTNSLICQSCGQLMHILECFETGGQCIYCGGWTETVSRELLEDLNLQDLYDHFEGNGTRNVRMLPKQKTDERADSRK